jgi:hypothetical protein
MANSKDNDKELSWSEVAQGAKKSGVHSFIDTALAPLQPFLHPLQTAETLKQVGVGIGSKAKGFAGVQQSPEEKAKNEAALNAIGDYYSSRYGSIKGFKQALASDPAGVLADIAGVATLGTGAAVRAPGMLGKAMKIANKASMLADPTNLAGWAAVRAPTAIYSKLSEYKGPALSGIGGPNVAEARKAGLNKVPEYNMARTGNISGDDIVDMADAGLAKLKASRDAKYKNNKAYLNASTKPLDYTDIENKISDLRKANQSSKGIPIDPAAEKTLNDIESDVQLWKQSGHNNAGDFDDLKQRISRTHAAKLKAQDPSWNQAVATGVLGSVRDTIKKQVPEYSAFMKDYADASDLINEMRTSLALGNKASYASGITKLRNAFKGNKGAGAFETLKEVAPELPAAIAGFNMKEWLPQGYGQYISPLAVGLAGGTTMLNPLGIPLTVNTAIHSSPRVLGRVTYGGGAASRYATKWTPQGQRAVIASRELEEANQNRPITLEEMDKNITSPGLQTHFGEYVPPEPASEPNNNGITPDQLEKMFDADKSHNIDQLLNKTKKIESHGQGDYGAIGPVTKHGRAYGAYQVMEGNIPAWTQEVLGNPMTKEEFLQNPEAQEKVARAKMEQYYNKYGNVQDVSSVWHSGVPLAQAEKEHRADVNMPTTEYVKRATTGIDSEPPPVENPEFPVGDSRRYPAAVTVGDRQGRATGGRIMNHRSEADNLIRLADKTKKALNNSTESLLAVPDEAVTKALSIANEAI